MFVWGFLRWFLWELILFKIIVSKKTDHESIFTFASIFFNAIINIIIFLVWKGVIGMLWEQVKICGVCGYAFYMWLKIKKVASKKLRQVYLKHTTNSNLEKRITTLEKFQAKTEQYSRMYNVEISGISNDVLDNDLEEKLIEICKDSDIVITSSDIEGCHRLPLGRNSTSENKLVIVKFVNRKHSELMLRLKKNISSKSKVYINNSFAHITVFYGGSVKSFKERLKYINFFVLGQ